MKYAIILITSLLVGFSNYAQDKTQIKDPKAKAILDKLTEAGKTYKTVKASFDYNLKNADADIDDTQSGQVWIKGDKYKITLNGMERYSDGKTIWTYLPDDDELQIAEAGTDDSEQNMKPSDLFTMYQNGFNYMYEAKTTINGKSLDVIKLFPEKGGKPYHTIKLFVDSSNNEIYQMLIMNKDGNHFTYTIKKMETNLELADSFFKFDESKAGDIIDLR
tara:strand:- start:15 stop:671 length:657 start_codon:yes stop_codon:yes gene_type:complete